MSLRKIKESNTSERKSKHILAPPPPPPPTKKKQKKHEIDFCRAFTFSNILICFVRWKNYESLYGYFQTKERKKKCSQNYEKPTRYINNPPRNNEKPSHNNEKPTRNNEKPSHNNGKPTRNKPVRNNQRVTAI